jgi:hypothetical protein
VDSVRPASGERVLLKDQIAAPQNGIYVAGGSGAELVSPSQVFDGSGHYAVTGLTAGGAYSWTKGGETTSLDNGLESLTGSGWFLAAGTSITLNGSVGDDVLDSIKAAILTRATDADAAGEFVRHQTVSVTAGTVNAGRVFSYVGKASPTLGTDVLTFAAGPQAITVP